MNKFVQIIKHIHTKITSNRLKMHAVDTTLLEHQQTHFSRLLCLKISKPIGSDFPYIKKGKDQP